MLKQEKIPVEQAIIDRHRAYLKTLHDETYEIKVQVLEGGKLPAKAHKTDAGFDVYATADIELYPGQVIKHPLNIKMELPKGSWAQIETKSGLGAKGMLVYAGVIDESYRGIPHVVMTNVKMSDGFSKFSGSLSPNLEPILVKKGEKLAQFTMNPHNNNFFITEVALVYEKTDRGAGVSGAPEKLKRHPNELVSLIQEISPMARVIDMRCEYQKDYGDLVCHLTLLFTNRREDTKGDIVEYVTNKYGEYFMGHVRQIKDQTPMDYFHSFEGMSIVERVNDFSTHEFEMYFDDVEMAVALLEERVAWSRYSKQFDSQIEKVLKK